MKLWELSADRLAKKIRNREVTVTEAVTAYLDRIGAIDGTVGSYLSVLADRALEDASRIQRKISDGSMTSRLAGVPYGLKDVICTKGVPTTCASRMLHNFVPPYNATVVERLDENGVVLLGKLNMDEFAMGGSTENSFFKKTRNPWDTERVPGGSSGGSAASVACGEAAFSLGSDTGGSIRQPASFCGIVGLKPTYGLVSRFGLVAFASSLDQIGPLTRDVTDCALVLNAISGHDALDATSAPIERQDYTRHLVPDVKGLRIGLPKQYLAEGLNTEVRDAVLRAAAHFEAMGAHCGEVSLAVTEYAVPAYYIISSAEASSNLARYDGVKYGYRAGEYDDLIDMYRKTRSEGFGAEVKRRIMLGTYALSSGYYDAYYKKALQVRSLIMDAFDKAFAEYDVIIGPTAPTTAYRIGEKVDNPLEMYLGDIYTVSVNIAGLPGMVVPCGLDASGLPIGLQLIGKPFSEPVLFKAAYAFEQSTEYHKAGPDI